MNCKEIEQLLHEYIDGGLDSSGREIVEKHIAGCPSCREQVVQLKKMVSVMSSFENIPTPKDFLQGVRAKIESKQSLLDKIRSLIPARVKLSHSFGVVGIVVLFLGIFIWGVMREPNISRHDELAYETQRQQRESYPSLKSNEVAFDRTMREEREWMNNGSGMEGESTYSSTEGRRILLGGTDRFGKSVTSDKDSEPITVSSIPGEPGLAGRDTIEGDDKQLALKTADTGISALSETEVVIASELKESVDKAPSDDVQDDDSLIIATEKAGAGTTGPVGGGVLSPGAGISITRSKNGDERNTFMKRREIPDDEHGLLGDALSAGPAPLRRINITVFNYEKDILEIAKIVSDSGGGITQYKEDGEEEKPARRFLISIKDDRLQELEKKLSAHNRANIDMLEDEKKESRDEPIVLDIILEKDN